MQIVENLEIDLWLDEVWDCSLDWDLSNIYKLDKHKLTVEDVEALLDGQFLYHGEILPPAGMDFSHGEQRYLLSGHIPDGRYFSLVFTTRGTMMRPITCRRIWNKQRKEYNDQQQKHKSRN